MDVWSDDILHARIQTMGVTEHIFDVNIHGKSVTWHLYDVGGARGQRHSWVPYFDDANAIIFVAPVSAFDQVSFSGMNCRHCLWMVTSISKRIPEQTGSTIRCSCSRRFVPIAYLKVCIWCFSWVGPRPLRLWKLDLLDADKTDLLKTKLDRGLKVRK